MYFYPAFYDYRAGNTQCMKQGQFMPVLPADPKLAHAYVPFQHMTHLYQPMQGLSRGTIFPELDRPYGVDPEYTVDA